MRLLTFSVILAVCESVCGLKILGLFAHKGKSHFYTFEPIMQALAEKGHEVTLISHFPQKQPLANFTDVDISSGSVFMHVIDLESLSKTHLQRYVTALMVAHVGYKSCTEVLSNGNFIKFMNSSSRFDVVLTEIFSTHCFLGSLQQFESPIIGVSSCNMMAWDDFIVGVPSNPSYIPNSFLSFNNKMTFLERLENALMYVWTVTIFELFVDIPGKIVASDYYSKFVPNLKSIATNISLLLVNNHFSLSLPRPLPPNYIDIDGVHLKPLKRPPLHIDKWINESKHGVIYFSLGSMIKGHTFPEEKKQMFINAFSRLPQRVLWKWENETMLGKTDNIMIEKWMPQFDILCHPNVKVFIAHGGMLGVTEAVHCGVPMIIMPQFGDQFTNAKAVEASGGGLILDYRYLDEESIYKALTTALDPKSYKNAKELSARFKDRPMPPLETAIYWIEYVARHGGAPHLRTAAVGMPLYQYLLLDVIAFLAFILFSFIFIVYYITRAVLRRFCGSKKSTKKVKKN